MRRSHRLIVGGMGVVLIGYRGSGKTTVGRLLAERLAKAFVDCDEVIVARQGKSIREIFLTQGEEAFRKAETQVISELASSTDCVIALGGGAIVREENRRARRDIRSFTFAARRRNCCGESRPTRRVPIIGPI